MARLRLRTTALIASYIVFFVVLFGTIETIEGLKCYKCVSVNGGNSNCENAKDLPSVTCGNPMSQDSSLNAFDEFLDIKLIEKSQGNSSLQGLKGGPSSLTKGNYASSPDYACSKSFAVATGADGKEGKALVRSCADMNLQFAVILKESNNELREFSFSTCRTDECNSSERVEIGATSLILSLLVFFWSKT